MVELTLRRHRVMASAIQTFPRKLKTPEVRSRLTKALGKHGFTMGQTRAETEQRPGLCSGPGTPSQASLAQSVSGQSSLVKAGAGVKGVHKTHDTLPIIGK